ncbi:MAG TPA: hypothetical protein VN152_00780, partial [Sphingopyxis sp.]|nr:hypothetical protein [Sphingopyxis sp.]
MLAAEAEAEDPARNAAQQRDGVEQAHREGHAGDLAAEHRFDDALMREALDRLHARGGCLAAVLHLRQQRIGVGADGERRCEDIRGRDGVLHREV